MGLDITHYKATLQAPQTTDPYALGGMTEENYQGFDVPFEFFERYIQTIEEPEIIKTTILVTQQQYLEETVNWFNRSPANLDIVFVERDLIEVIQETEKKYGLRGTRSHVSQSIKWKTLYHYVMKPALGFYQSEEGYQRKGMNSDFNVFYEDPDKTEFVEYEDFQKAYECIDFYWDDDTAEDVKNMRANFRKNFLEKYERGSSTLSLSY